MRTVYWIDTDDGIKKMQEVELEKQIKDALLFWCLGIILVAVVLCAMICFLPV